MYPSSFVQRWMFNIECSMFSFASILHSATIRHMKPTLLSAFILLLSGCSVVTNMTTAKATFTIQVKNQTSEPIRIGLTKDGPPQEDQWWSPEEFAIFNARRPDISWGQIVLPGQVANIPSVDGRFSDGVHAILRVYAGNPALSDMLAISRNSPNRLDLPLAEGDNRFLILEDSNRLAAKRMPPAPPTPGTK